MLVQNRRPPVRAGDLRSRLTLERRTVTTNADNEQVTTWVPWRTVWAHIEPLEGRRRYVGSRLQTDVTTRITTRYFPDFDELDVRGVCAGQVYDFEVVIDPELRHRELWIDAVARR